MQMKSDSYHEHTFGKVNEIQETDALAYDWVEVKGITVTNNIFPIESLYNSTRWFQCPERFRIDVYNMFWRFNDNMVYALTIKPGIIVRNKSLLLHKYVLKTMHQQLGSITEDTGFDSIEKLKTIEKYMFHKDFMQVGMDLLDNLMWSLGEEYKKRKDENKD